MLNLLKRSKGIENADKQESVNNKTINEVIEEIHETFYTEVDRLLEFAKNHSSLETDKQDLIDKGKRLRQLGFTRTKEVVESDIEIERLRDAERQNRQKAELIEAIKYFSFKYPNYKFITEGSVNSICKKYDLVRGQVDRYIGTVPDENLKHIENFKISEEDECYIKRHNRGLGYMGYATVEQYLAYKNSFESVGIKSIDIIKLGLEIVAPVTDFDMQGMEVKDNKVVVHIPDPIVLKPVMYNREKHYLIVTAWGLEASDELVVNPKHN